MLLLSPPVCFCVAPMQATVVLPRFGVVMLVDMDLNLEIIDEELDLAGVPGVTELCLGERFVRCVDADVFCEVFDVVCNVREVILADVVLLTLGFVLFIPNPAQVINNPITNKYISLNNYSISLTEIKFSNV